MDLKTPLVDALALDAPVPLFSDAGPAPKPRSEYEAHLIRKQNDFFYHFATWFKPSADTNLWGNEDAVFVYKMNCLKIYERHFPITPETLMEFDKRIDEMFPPPVFEIIRDENNGWHQGCADTRFEYKITIRWVRGEV